MRRNLKNTNRETCETSVKLTFSGPKLGDFQTCGLIAIRSPWVTLHLKIGGWNTIFLLGWPVFRAYSFGKCKFWNDSCEAEHYILILLMDKIWLRICDGWNVAFRPILTISAAWMASQLSAPHLQIRSTFTLHVDVQSGLPDRDSGCFWVLLKEMMGLITNQPQAVKFSSIFRVSPSYTRKITGCAFKTHLVQWMEKTGRHGSIHGRNIWLQIRLPGIL